MGNYYVSIIDGDRQALALGPFRDHATALSKVDNVQAWIRDHAADYPGEPWWAFGTARVPEGAPVPVGTLNFAMGVPVDGNGPARAAP